jgi:hypothetical protein
MTRAWIGLVLICWSAEAFAGKEATVRRHKARAFERLEAGDYAGAISEMEKAYALIPHPGFLLNIAVAYDRWEGHCAESLEAFERFFAECGSCDLGVKAKRTHAEVEAACHVEVSVVSTPDGATVAIDGAVRGRTPFEARLLPGAYAVLLDKAGYDRRTQAIRVERGRPVRLSIELVERSDPPPPMISDAPPAIRTEVEPAGPSPFTWVAFGAGAAGLATGIAFTVLTVRDLDDEERARNTPLPKAEIVAIQREAKRDAIIAHVGYGIGAAGIAAGMLLLFLTGGERAVAVAPVLGPGTVGLAGTF